MNLKDISACLITKDPVYPQEIINHVSKFGFGEILILTNCDSPHRKYELFEKAKYDLLYYQDDDAICPIKELVAESKPGILNIAMKTGHIEAYKDKKMTMGMGWGSIFEKSILQSLKRYTHIYGEDELYKRETERILTQLNYPQNRLDLPVIDLPSAYAADRLWRQPQHHENLKIVEERCAKL